MFELMASMQDPINLSIGQADYDPPAELVEAAVQALRAGHHRYTLTQGLPELNERILQRVEARHGRRLESSLVTAGVSGGLVLTFQSLLDPGDEILLPDPGFMMYRHLANLCSATIKWYSTYPDQPGQRFRIDPDEIAALVTDRTKVVFLNSPSNPTGGVLTAAEVQAVCEIANRRGAFVVSDEIYDQFVYEGDYASPVRWAERVVQLGGFSKTWGVPGWRLGWAAGPRQLLDAMKTLQQFTFVCAPTPLQHAVLAAAFDVDLSQHRIDYRHKRDRIAAGLHPAYGLHPPEGSFYAFPGLPGGVGGDEFLEAAVQEKLLVVPGKSFSRRDTHFRLSFAADDATLERGIIALNRLAERFC